MPLANLDIQKQPESTDTQLILRLNGKLSLAAAAGFVDELRPVPTQVLLLDMSGVTFIDSAGIGALVQLFVHRRNTGQKFALAALTPQGSAVMLFSGMARLLPIYETIAQALAASS